MSKGVFIEGITVDMLRNASLEAVEDLLNDGDIVDMEVTPSEWIPVSERLPERGKDVLVTRKYYGKDDGNKDDIYVEISACYADGEEWHGYSDEYKMNPRNHKVVAWMPLPEPYREDGEA